MMLKKSRILFYMTRNQIRLKSTEASAKDLVLFSNKNNVTTITLNNPAKLNSWGMALAAQMLNQLSRAASDPETKVVILTGTDPYFSSGGSLAEIFSNSSSPRGVQRAIQTENEKIFNGFIEFPKPMIAAVNGPAIGGGTTSAALCDIILASDKAIFSTPFKQLGVNPEGCSSVHFERMLGEDVANKLLNEGWKPTAIEAKECGLVEEVIQHESLLVKAQDLGEIWAREGKERCIRGGGSVEEYKKINAEESAALAQAFVSEKFIRTQLEMLKKRGKSWSGTAVMMWLMLKTRFIWIKFL